MAVWYCGSVHYAAVAQWAATTVYSVGDLRRQLAVPSVGNERVFRCTTAGTSGGSEPSWNLTKGATTNDGSAVWTEVTGNSTYGWTAPHARMWRALTWMDAGDDLYVSDDHDASQTGAITFTSSGTAASPCRVICVDRTSGTPPTVRAVGARETNTSPNNITIRGYAYVYGFYWRLNEGGSTGFSNAFLPDQNNFFWRFEKCRISLKAAQHGSETGAIYVGSSSLNTNDCRMEWIDTDVEFNSTGQRIHMYGPLVWRGGSVINTVIPTALFRALSPPHAMSEINGVDFSAMGSGKSLIELSSTGFVGAHFVNCKINNAVSLHTGNPVGQGGMHASFTNCDSGDTNYKFRRVNYMGQEDYEIGRIRTDGANDGTIGIARKIVSTANSKHFAPYETLPIIAWNNEVGSPITVELSVLTDNVTLTDAEAWIEVEYLGTSGLPLSLRISDQISDPIFGTPANQATDAGSTWDTTGIGTPVKQKFGVTFTPQEKGWIRARVCLAKPSTTMYYDPHLQGLS